MKKRKAEKSCYISYRKIDCLVKLVNLNQKVYFTTREFALKNNFLMK